MSTSTNADVVQQSLRLLAAHRNELAAHFYGRLFGRYPHLERYFVGSNTAWLERKFAAALRSIMQAASSPREFERQVAAVSEAHANRDVAPEYFESFAEVLIESLAYYGGRGWTPDVEDAWRSVLATVVTSMRGAYGVDGVTAVSEREAA